MSRFVVDASVVLAWCFPDELAVLAVRVADRFRHGDTGLAPSFWPHEVLNALLVGEKRKRISSRLVQSFLDDLAVLPITLEPCASETVFDRIQSLSRKCGLTTYDAAYLDLALQHRLPLATLDEDLILASGREGVELFSQKTSTAHIWTPKVLGSPAGAGATSSTLLRLRRS